MRDPGARGRAFKTGMRLLVLAIALSAHGSAAQSQCVGDCAADGAVTISDLILGVNIALGLQPVTACPPFQNAQGEVDIAQLIRGVNNALGGCPAVATATATATRSGTATSTPPPDATPTHTAAATATATATRADTATSTPPPDATATHTAAASATATATEATAPATPTATGVAPATSTSTSTAQSTATATRTASRTATQTSASTVTPPSAGTATHTPTVASTATSTVHTPTRTATDEPTATSTTPPSTATVSQSPTASPTSTVTAPASATATETRTASTTATATRTATATETAIPVGELVAGHIAIASAGLRAVNSLVAAFVSQATKAGGAVLQGTSSRLVFGGPAPDPNACSVSGTSERTCTEMGAGNDKTIQLALDAVDCVVAGPSGGTAFFSGMITVDSNPSSANACDPLVLTSGMYEFGPSGSVEGLLVIFRDALMEPTLAVRAEVSGAMAIGQPPLPTCRVGTLMLTLEGIVLTQFGDGSEALGIQMGFSGTELTVDMITYNADCVPLSYRLRVNGLVSFTATRAGPALTAGGDGSVGGIGMEVITSFTADFTNLFLAQSHASGSVTSQISGQISSDCFGAEVMIATVNPIVVGAGDICPNAGQLSLTSFAGPATVTYQGSQVNVVEGGSEKIFPSCFADMLVTCIPQ
jgi:hypothetical protein